MRQRPLLVTAGWLVAAVAATATGIAGVAVIGRGITGPTSQVLSADDIEKQLASPGITPTGSPGAVPTDAATGSPPRPTPSATTNTTPTAGTTANTRRFNSTAGSVLAQCHGSTAKLLVSSPANGYRLREEDQTSGAEAEVSFERDGQRVKIKVTCPGGSPQFRVDD